MTQVALQQCVVIVVFLVDVPDIGVGASVHKGVVPGGAFDGEVIALEVLDLPAVLDAFQQPLRHRFSSEINTQKKQRISPSGWGHRCWGIQ